MSVDYGTDIAWDGELLPGREDSGETLVRTDAVIRLMTARGSCPGAPNDGIDLVELLHAEQTDDERRRLPGLIRSELAKDERIVRSSLEVEIDWETSPIEVSIDGALSGGETFRWVVGVDELTVADLTEGASS